MERKIFVANFSLKARKDRTQTGVGKKVALKIICFNVSETQQKLCFLAQNNENISGKTNMKRNIHEYLTCMKKISKSDFRFGTFPPDAKLSNVYKFSIPFSC